MRPYLLQETLFILFVYLFVYLYQKIESEKPIDSWKNLLLIAFIVGLTLLSGYFAIFFIILFGIFLLYKLYEKKEIKSIYFIISAFISSVVFTFAVFPRYEHGFISLRGKEAVNKLTENFMENILTSLKRLIEILPGNLFNKPKYIFLLLCVALLYLFWEKRKRLYAFFKSLIFIQPLTIILLVSLIWASAIMIVAPYKIIRYISPVIPLLSLFIPYIVSKLDRPKIFILSLLLCVGIYGVVALKEQRIEHLYVDAYKKVQFNQYPELPVIVYINNTNECFHKNSTIISYVADNQTYEFPHSENSLLEKAMKYEKAILLIEASDNIDIVSSFDNYFLEKLDFDHPEIVWFTAYHIVRK